MKVPKLLQLTARTFIRSPAFRRQSLRLTLAGNAFLFATPREFDFCLAARTATPAPRIREMFTRPIAELDAETETLRALVVQFTRALEQRQDGSGRLAHVLQRLGAQTVTKDHAWREIFNRLLGDEPAPHAFLEVALRRYIEYLSERQLAARAIARMRGREADKREDTSDASATAAFDADLLELDQAGKRKALKRLPQGRPVILRLEPGREVMIKLARHDFSLAHEPDWSLIAETGERFELHSGTNSVGRSRANQIAVNSSLKQVSRTHLIAEPLGSDMIALTDVSSGGTYIPPEALAS